MAGITVQSAFPGTVGAATQSDDARRVNLPLPFVFTAWKDTTDARLVANPFSLLTAPRQGRIKAIAMRLDQALGGVVAARVTVARSFGHFDIFDQTEKPVSGHLFP